MSVFIVLDGPSFSGGTGADQVASADYANAAAAVAAISNGFLIVANPVDQGQTQSDGKSRAISASKIRDIRSF